ncbi:uncharacterized protein LOC6578084 [Drosophila mojavensis]|uniref:Cystatin domain-containing protein n=1 Tax=Drosophila mojavensis TaxID=7230 RepID=B4KIF1_DROMO|nr:uncharacterized protein LOC6578084 [Drosophila mojavensis]EDW13448.1 uncharacterized protein Dmoj_GI19934 [Drosophila mojavensis]
MSGWLWFLVCLGFSIAAHHRSFRFEVNNFYIRPTVRDIFESINWTQPNRSTLSIAWILKRQIDQMDLETSLDIIKSDKQKMRLYHIRLDACKFLTTIHKNRIFTLLAKSVNRGSNEHLKCPLKPSFNYTISNMHLSEDDFPQYVPECHFKAISKFYIHQKVAVRMLLEGEVDYKH